MSKADELGTGRFGGGVRTVSARRQAVAAATGVPTEGVAPPTKLSVHRISLNPDNPRSALGDLTDLAGSLKTHGQKQAITVMNRDAYVKANPAREDDLEPDTTYVVVDGSSRLAAAREAGLDTVRVMVSDEEGTNSEEILESALVANIHRQDLGELDEARALKRLLAIHGSQRALAKRLHRSQGWVSQRIALLSLTPELQARIGKEPIDLLRAVASKPADQQEGALEALKAERARKEQPTLGQVASHRSETASVPDAATGSAPTGDYAVITRGAPDESEASQTGHGSQGDYGVITTDSTTPTETEQQVAGARAELIPEPRTTSAARTARKEAEQGPRPVPYDRPDELATLLSVKITDTDTFFTLLEVLSARGLDRDAARLGELARSLVEQAEQRVI